MESLQKTLETFLDNRQWQGKLKEQMDEVLHHPTLLRFQQMHPHLEEEAILRALSKVGEAIREGENCAVCTGLTSCPNVLKGHYATLYASGQMVDVSYTACAFQETYEADERRSKLIKSHYIPKDILGATFHDLDTTDQSRDEAISGVLEFCLRANPGVDGTGVYVYGPLGVGKSYLLGAACHELAKRNIGTLMIYSPDFFREMKEAIADQSVSEKLQVLKETPVLIFDDIGAENMSAWVRDEIFGAILQYRVTEKLPTLFSSNYNYDQLEEHLAYSQRGGIEQLKAKRIMERIRHYSKAYFVNGSNRRRESLVR